MSVDPDTVRLFSHHLMAAGFVAALVAMLSIRRYGHALIFLIALIEAYADIRYPFHVAVRDFLLESGHDTAAKMALQMRLLIGVGVAGALAMLLLTPVLLRMATGRRLIATGMAIILATFCLELISLHAIDAILYHPIGPFARCAVAYFIGALLAAEGALVERRRQGGQGRQGGDSLPT